MKSQLLPHESLESDLITNVLNPCGHMNVPVHVHVHVVNVHVHVQVCLQASYEVWKIFSPNLWFIVSEITYMYNKKLL